MRQQRLQASDYTEVRKSKKQGRYGVTVPKPFGFEIRDQVRSKSIRERKIERMVQEKEAEEDEAMKV